MDELSEADRTKHFMGPDLYPPCTPPPGGYLLVPDPRDVDCQACIEFLERC